ncbi:MAG: phosphatidate cytidylyltransferase [Clostridia bacterium]|nr:phosphatidate cytidylyltransferase [Clostridia bacterium]
MLTRIITAVVALCLLVPILLFAPAWAVASVFALLGAVAVYEFFSCVGFKKEVWLWVVSILSLTLSIGCSIASMTLIEEYVFEDWFKYLSMVPSFLQAITVLAFILAAVVRYKQLPVDRLVMLFGLFWYTKIGFTALAGLALEGSYYGKITGATVPLWVALCIPWVADTLAYFSGFFFGKRKLCPEISPKKTIEGAIGGVAGTGIVAVLVYGFAKSWELLPLLVVFFGAMILAVVSIYGDLFASVVKRHFGVKDYGKLFPGHGGIMDRFDSTIPVAITLQVLLLIPYVEKLL